MRNRVEWHEEASPGLVASALAKTVAGNLASGIATRGSALLAVSGGTTPVRFFDALSHANLAWDKVTVILADERFTPIQSDRSNARLVALNLLQHKAAKAHFEGLYEPAETVEDAARNADERYRALPFPPDVMVLGMGLDGHVASLFPDWDGLAGGLDLTSAAHVMPVRSPGAREPRLTLPLARIVSSTFIALLIEGYDKKEMLLETLEGLRDRDAPVLAVIKNAKAPVHIFWAPRDAK